MITHKKQKTFNVVVMKYKNSSIYVQRQIDRFLRSYRNYAKIYVNDIVIHFEILKKHFRHFKKIFNMFTINNIFIKSKKIFINYFTMHLLKQKINFFDLITTKKKLKIIFRLFFSISLQLLEIYFEFIDWLRDYVFWYVDFSLSLQKLKTKLFREKFVVDNVKTIYFRNIKIKNFIVQKIVFFESFQSLLTKFFYFVHANLKRKLFVDFDFNKKFDFVDMIYHVKKFVNWKNKKYSSRKIIKSIFFESIINQRRNKILIYKIKICRHRLSFEKDSLFRRFFETKFYSHFYESRRRFEYSQTNQHNDRFYRQIQFSFRSCFKLHSTIWRKITSQVRKTTHYVKCFVTFCQHEHRYRFRRKKIKCVIHRRFNESREKFSSKICRKLLQRFSLKKIFRRFELTK